MLTVIWAINLGKNKTLENMRERHFWLSQTLRTGVGGARPECLQSAEGDVKGENAQVQYNNPIRAPL